MRPILYESNRLLRRFRRETVLTMAMIEQELGTSAKATVFRKLKGLRHRASYSHAGKYHTVDELAQFDRHGLWTFHDIRFSRQGTLVDTLAFLIEQSAAGYFAAELQSLVHVRVFNALTHLVTGRRVERARIAGEYCYFSPRSGAAQQEQRNKWLQAQASPERNLAVPGFTATEAIACLPRFLSLLNEKQTRIYLGLEALKLGHGGDVQIARLTGVNVKTIAKGRRELEANAITPERIRRLGAGRPAIKKNGIDPTTG